MNPDQIRSTRKSLGLNQTDIAERLGVTQATVSNWETGATAPNADQAKALGELLNHGPSAATEGPTSPQAKYGEWLVATRTESGLSRQQLADRAGISEPQIWNIETGRTLNPRSETRLKLERSLGTSAPGRLVEAIEEEAEIESVGRFADFDPHDVDDFPADAGVYVFYDVSDRPIYVGESGNIRERIRDDHLTRFWYKRPIVETAAYVRVDDQKLRRQLEDTMIKFMRSNAVINQRQVLR